MGTAKEQASSDRNGNFEARDRGNGWSDKLQKKKDAYLSEERDWRLVLVDFVMLMKR